MEIVKLIINEAKIMKSIIIAANQLTNAEYDFKTKDIFKRRNKDNLEKEILKFRDVIKRSPLSAKNVKIILILNSVNTYNFAREIVINFTKQEIKDS